MMQKRRPKGCEPGEGCFRCRLRDCRYNGGRSQEERDLYAGSTHEMVGEGYMPPTHQRNRKKNHR